MEYSVKYRKKCDDKHESVSSELTKLYEIKNRLANNGVISSYININDLNRYIIQLQIEHDDVLIERKKKFPYFFLTH
jgi:hypothetical protein